MKEFIITGTKHGSYVYAKSEGEARNLFHKKYMGESILTVKIKGKYLQKVNWDEI